MEPRIKNPAMLLPGAMPAIQGLLQTIEKSTVPPKIFGLAHLRASQINGCGVCVEMARLGARRHDETMERLFAVAAWRETPYFSDAERAALALTECVTRLADRADPVPDDVWAEAARHFDEAQLAALILSISLTNLFNRVNASTRQIAGQQKW